MTYQYAGSGNQNVDQPMFTMHIVNVQVQASSHSCTESKSSFEDVYASQEIHQ